MNQFLLDYYLGSLYLINLENQGQKTLKLEFCKESNSGRQKVRQKVCQKISVIITTLVFLLEFSLVFAVLRQNVN